MDDKPDGVNKRKVKTKKSSYKWIIEITLITFVISSCLSGLSNSSFQNINPIFASVLLVVIILIGVICDVIGISVASADKKPFVSMASKKVYGAREALSLIKNADRVSNFFNDVIGDICGIISGTICVIIVSSFNSSYFVILNILMTALVSSATVGLKAFSKGFAIKKSIKIVHLIGKMYKFIKNIFRIK